MKSKNLIKEAIIWLIILVPLIYYFIVRTSLPEQIPIHFNASGQPDNWTDPKTFFWLIIGMTLGIYLLLIIIPLIDPKRKIQLMGGKYFAIKLILVSLMAIISIFMIYTALHPELNKALILNLIISALFIVIGNYLPSVKPNYFIGIRTPWTLEYEDIWRKTHRLTGWVWTIGGFILLLLSIILTKKLYFILIVIIITLVIIPIIHSFVLYLRRKQKEQNV